MSFGAPELLVILGPIIVVGVAFSIWVLVDVRRYPAEAFERCGMNRTVWVVVASVAIVACLAFNVVGVGAALIMALIWRTAVRPRIVAA